jgi:hypothetical protein
MVIITYADKKDKANLFDHWENVVFTKKIQFDGQF